MRASTIGKVVPLILAICLAGVGCTGSSTDSESPNPTYRSSGCASVLTATKRALQGVGVAVGLDEAEDELIAARDQLAIYELTADDTLRTDAQQLHDAVAKLSDTLQSDPNDKVLNAAVTTAAKRLGVIQRRCGPPSATSELPAGAKKIKHVIIVMQENRSFDHYFGTFPGADGIPMKNGVPTVCIRNPATGGCTAPFHIADVVHEGGPHTLETSRADINGGKMDGFIAEWNETRTYCLDPEHAGGQICQTKSNYPAVVGYHDSREIPNYWEYAKQFVLQDHMFAPNMGWSQPAHLAIVSGWSAACRSPYVAITCRPSVTFNDVDAAWPDAPSYGWTDITYLLEKFGVSWRYYVAPGSVDDCEGTTDEQIHCTPGVGDFDPIGTPEPWNPLPDFTTVQENNQVGNVQFHPRFFKAAREGTLPSVTWVMPGWYDSEHPPESVASGQAWVTRVVNAVAKSPNWKSSAIFVAWDDWGGFYDHVPPPKLDKFSYGLRVPAFMISPYAKRGMIDSQELSFDAYLKFIEDLFLDGRRIDPYTDGRWDPRPRVAEEAPNLGDLMKEFDFSQKPRAPIVLPPYPSP